MRNKRPVRLLTPKRSRRFLLNHRPRRMFDRRAGRLQFRGNSLPKNPRQKRRQPRSLLQYELQTPAEAAVAAEGEVAADESRRSLKP
ncbi:MAG: hypothetical protein WA899_10575, partial [Candidatus Sulfotelmatobacter sp.]